MLTCREITGIVSDYLDGELGWWDRFRFQLHLGLCAHCRTYVAQMRESRALAAELPPPEMPDHVRDSLRARFKDWKRD